MPNTKKPLAVLNNLRDLYFRRVQINAAIQSLESLARMQKRRAYRTIRSQVVPLSEEPQPNGDF